MALGVLSGFSPKIVHASPTGIYFSNIVTIMMENNGYCDVVTSALGTGCSGSGSYETSLSQSYSIAGNCQSDSSCSSGGYTAIDHNSQPNYVVLAGGFDPCVSSGWSCPSSSDGHCCYQLSNQNIIDRLESAGLTWNAWAENAGNSGTCSFNPPRNADHFPWIEFSDMNTSPRCSHFQTTTAPSTPSGQADNEFISSLTTSAPNFIWLTPTDNDNGHDTGVSGGDTWLSGIVPRILNSPLFTATGSMAALFIVYDEGNSAYPHDYLYASWSGPRIRSAFIGTGSYSHYSWLKTLEANWVLNQLTTNDGTANAMNEFFKASWNPYVGCTPTVVRISGITNNQTASSTSAYGPYTPGITTSVSGGNAKRWLTQSGLDPAGWQGPGPACSITDSNGQVIASFVEIDGVGRGGWSYEDCRSTYDTVNGGGAMPAGHWCDSTGNLFDPAQVPNYSTSCTSNTDPTCYGRIHVEFDGDWLAAGECGSSVPYCNNNTLVSSTTSGSASTLIDVQGFVSWDSSHTCAGTPTNCPDAWHNYNGWELHPLTAWRPHSSTTYTLTFQGYDYDGAQEETLTLNNQLLTQLPTVDSPQNAGVYVSFTVDMTSLVVQGTNTLVFTHANWDCGVTETTKNVQVTNGSGTVIFGDSTERALNCTTSITYTFNV